MCLIQSIVIFIVVCFIDFMYGYLIIEIADVSSPIAVVSSVRQMVSPRFAMNDL